MNRALSPTSSEETTATSAPTHGYVCCVCFRVFPTGRSLGGHQNAHLFERAFRLTRPTILGAVLNHPPPQQNVHVLASTPAGSHPGSRHHHPPNPLLQQPAAATLGLQTMIGENGDEHHHPLEGRVKFGTPQYHPYERRSSVGSSSGGVESHRRALTKNLLSEWKPMNKGKEVQIMVDPSADHEDELELELSLKRKEYIDLKLKLGF